MNKQMIVLIAFVAVVFAMPASAETVEVRGDMNGDGKLSLVDALMILQQVVR